MRRHNTVSLSPTQRQALDDLHAMYKTVVANTGGGSVQLGIYLALRSLARRSADLVDVAVSEGRRWCGALKESHNADA